MSFVQDDRDCEQLLDAVAEFLVELWAARREKAKSEHSGAAK